ncbi:MAG: riboflavin synthase [Bacillota bacterium]
MFTGLIEDLGIVQEIKKGAKYARLSIKTRLNLEEMKNGDSISVNGVCLTITEKTNQMFSADVMWETLQKTSFINLTPGAVVNLERAMKLGGRLDGHLVSGHVDGIGIIREKKQHEIAEVFEINADTSLTKYMIKKGSVAVDGISLTLVEVFDDYFVVSIIPHTMKKTTLGSKGYGDVVNIEVDMLAKYVEKFVTRLGSQVTEGVTYEKLLENGFI